ncbi:hypothetical protein [Streptomyces poonensis]|uniref:Uncharacterized protein n=1 Tax=Streptomyces poonensis TaxID=68255 RepID=A0A918Q6H7_9ACTN|nr:hypothetical protein [Streptomyces poonensis]GGZ33851.1 hypothetical protein GCM10010365_63380 [Streptomyces poonensis]GLJ89221.1 hypothetical protein GCM10017589_18210 [Streptomyces poonensis]
MRDVHDELRARLREAAAAHEPDRARILARIERGMSEEARPARSAHRARHPLSGWAGWMRLAGATAAVAGILGVGGYAVASAVKGDEPADRTVVTSPTPVVSPDATSRAPLPPDDPAPTGGTSEQPSGTPSAEGSEEPKDRESKGSASSRPPVARDVESGPLWSDGSVDPHSNEFWAQSNVTLKTEEKLTALTVELRIALTEGVTSTGAWRSLPERDFTLTTGEEDGFLVYRWVLKEGRTVPAGEWVFAGQYDHERGGRDAGDDDYTITATADGEQRAVGGDFARQGDDDSDEGDS